jgi:hypothetical protein
VAVIRLAYQRAAASATGRRDHRKWCESARNDALTPFAAIIGRYAGLWSVLAIMVNER